MAITQVGTAGAQSVSTTSGGSLAPTIPTHQPGDALYVVIAGRPTDTTEPGTPSGWAKLGTSLREVGTNDLRVSVYRRIATAAGTTVSFTVPASWSGTSAGMSAQAFVLRGVDLSTPEDVTVVENLNAAAAATWQPTGIDTATNGAWVLSVVATADDNALGFSVANGFTSILSGGSYDTTTGGDHAVAVGYIEKATAGTQTSPTWSETLVGNDAWAGVTIAVRPFVAAAPGDSYGSTVYGTSGLVSYWRLGESVSTVPAKDVKGANHGGYVASPTMGVTGGTVGSDTAITLNGSSQYVDVADSASLDLADGPFSIEAWINAPNWSSGTSINAIVGKGTNAYLLFVNTSGGLVLAKRFVADIVTSTSTMSTSAWHHVVATKNGSAVKLYIDGSDVTGTVTNQTLADNTSGLAIGSEVGGSATSPFEGSIDEVAIYNVVLDATTVAAHYSAGTSSNVTVTPSTASLAITAYAPTVALSAHQTVTPATASLTATRFAPTVTASDHKTVTPATASLAATRYAPTVTASDHKTVTPATASLTATRYAPSVSTSDNKTVTPAVASLTLTPLAPTVTATAHVVVTPATATLVLTGFAPSVGSPIQVVPSVASLQLTAFAPSVVATDHKMVTPGTASLSLTGLSPTVTVSDQQVVVPGFASISLTAFAPSTVVSDHKTVTPGVATLSMTAFAPSTVISDHQIVTPGAAALVLASLAPVVTTSSVLAEGDLDLAVAFPYAAALARSGAASSNTHGGPSVGLRMARPASVTVVRDE